MNLEEALRAFFLQYGFERTYWIAYSGGLDSHVLLFLCNRLRNSFPVKLRAIHINHGLNPNANAWASHCEQMCKHYQVEYEHHSLQIDLQKGQSLEEIARDERYKLFGHALAEEDMLLTAHHQDDQAETVLLQLFRGAGIKGLAAMPIHKPFGKGFHARPLLTFPRLLLEQYALDHQLKWINDDSNTNRTLTRNFLRHHVLAELKTRWPSVANMLARSAAHCAEAQGLLEEYAAKEVKGLMTRNMNFTLNRCHASESWHPGFSQSFLDASFRWHEKFENTISVSRLLQYSPAKQKLLLRTWIKQSGYILPNAKKLATIIEQLLTARWDRTPLVAWHDVELRRYRDHLYLMTTLTGFESQKTYEWTLSEPLHLPSLGHLQALAVQGSGLRAHIQEVKVGFRQGGESAYIQGRGHHPLKKLFQEWNVAPWERDRIPLIFFEETLVAVVGYFLHPNFVAGNNELGHEILVSRRP